jgi:hypothetical protein
MMERMMSRLAMVLFSMASVSLAGVLVVAALVTGHEDARSILIAAVVGFVLAIPVSWWIAKQIEG